jgi:hypothetical protein
MCRGATVTAQYGQYPTISITQVVIVMVRALLVAPVIGWNIVGLVHSSHHHLILVLTIIHALVHSSVEMYQCRRSIACQCPQYGWCYMYKPGEGCICACPPYYHT